MSLLSRSMGVLCALTLLGFAAWWGARTGAPAGWGASIPPTRSERVLRVAADPNNLPFSNDRSEGFENRIAELIARELGAELRYVWRAQRRGFFRETLKAGEADVVIGVPAAFEMALTTAPYYRSTYAFVARADNATAAAVRSLDDPALRELVVGVQMIGDDGTNTPPAHALAARGIIDNLRGYTLYGDYREANPPARIIDAVADGEVDIAIVWGPLAGYFAPRSGAELAIAPVTPALDRLGELSLPMVYDIAVGVSRDNSALRNEIDEVLARERAQIGRILEEFGVPRADPAVPLPEPEDDDD